MLPIEHEKLVVGTCLSNPSFLQGGQVMRKISCPTLGCVKAYLPEDRLLYTLSYDDYAPRIIPLGVIQVWECSHCGGKFFENKEGKIRLAREWLDYYPGEDFNAPENWH